MRHNHQLPVVARNIEVVHLVGQMIAIGEDAAARAYRQRKGKAALVAVAARLHPDLHRALAHRVRIVEARQVLDRVVPHVAPPPGMIKSFVLRIHSSS
jgi:hypothetical protein